MAVRPPRLRPRDLGLLAGVTAIVLILGFIIARDLRRSADDADRLYQRLSQSVDVIDELQFATQEVRRILLYPLHTSDANLQLQYAEQSRAADAQVDALLARAAKLMVTPDGRDTVRRISEAWRRYLLVRDDVIGLILEGSLPDAVALDEREGTTRFNAVRTGIANLKRTYAQEASRQVEAARERASAATRRLTLLVVIALIAATFGITLVSRRAVLESLLRIEAQKGSILQAVPDPILTADKHGRIVELNEAAERAFGVSRDVAVGCPIEQIVVAPSRRGTVWPALAREGGSSRIVCPRLETVGSRGDGVEFPIEIAAVTHHVGGERVWTLHVSDLTDRLRTEEELRKAKDTAEAADRAKSEFLATMSHELRTPLVGVVGVADLLQDAGITTHQRDLISMLRSSASALLGIVSDILDYSRIEAGLVDLSPVAFDMRACIEDAFDPVTELAARKGLDLGYVVDPGVPSTLIADQARVRQVLLNLLSNAVKFTDAGEVAVSVSVVESHPGALLVRTEVRDTGVGIPGHLHDRLFQRFSRLHNTEAKYGSAGLGLAISERLSRLLGGSLTVESAVGGGSTFTFLFRAAGDRRASAERADDRPLDGKRLLVLGREGIVTAQLQSLLARWGAMPVMVFSPAALDQPKDYDAVIADADSFDGGIAAVEGSLLQAIAPAPLVVLTRLRSASSRPEVPVLNKPVKAGVLRSALEVCGTAAPPPAPPPVEPTPRFAFAADALRILLVEDNDANRRVIDLMINELGLRADVVGGGLDAVEAARRREYDVILMDLHMPDLDGFEAARRIRRERPSGAPAIIALTADAVQGEEARCRRAGMDGYLAKPLRLERLAAVLVPLALRRTSAD